MSRLRGPSGYRRANLEHAAASITNLFNSLVMIILLAIVVVGAAAPPFTIAGVHPVTVLLVATYGYGLWLSRRVREQPMWQPEETEQTELDVPEGHEPGESMAALWGKFLGPPSSRPPVGPWAGPACQ